MALESTLASSRGLGRLGKSICWKMEQVSLRLMIEDECSWEERESSEK